MPKIISFKTDTDQIIDVKERNILIVGCNGIGKTQYLHDLHNIKNLVNHDYKLNHLYRDCQNFKNYIDKTGNSVSLPHPHGGGIIEFGDTCNAWLKRTFTESFSIGQLLNEHKRYSQNTSDFLRVLTETFNDVNQDISEYLNSNHERLKKHFQHLYITCSQNHFKKLKNDDSLLVIEKQRNKLEQFLDNEKKIKLDLNKKTNQIEVKITDLDEKDKSISDSLSDGEGQIFAIFAYILTLEPAFYLWDEPEIYLHPKLQKKVIDYITEEQPRSTFIVVTHSLFVLQQALKLKNEWIVLEMKRDKDGIDFFKFNLKNSEVLSMYGLDESLFRLLLSLSLSGEKAIFVEGKTDKKYIELALNNEYKLIPLDGAGNSQVLVEAFKSFSRWAGNWILILDNDQEFGEQIKTYFKKCINLPGLEKGQAIESYFGDLITAKEIEHAGKKYKIIKNIKDFDYEQMSPETITANIKKHSILLQSDRIKKIFPTLYQYIPSKKVICDFLIKKHAEAVKEKLQELVKKIRENLQT